MVVAGKKPEGQAGLLRGHKERKDASAPPPHTTTAAQNAGRLEGERRSWRRILTNLFLTPNWHFPDLSRPWYICYIHILNRLVCEK